MSLALSPDFLEEVRSIVLAASEPVMDVYNSDFKVESKDDKSPVTEADRRAEAVIVPLLEKLAPDIPVVAEEAFSEGSVPDITGRPFWLVDPVDGTKQFIGRNGEFTVNIGLIDVDRRPVLGVVGAPALDRLYMGGPDGAFVEEGDARRAIAVRKAPMDAIIAVASRSHRSTKVDDFLAGYSVAEEITSGSSIKFCLVATGRADIYPRFGRTMEWDTAAGHAVLAAAGGSVTTVDGQPFLYAKPGFENPDFIARGNLA